MENAKTLHALDEFVKTKPKDIPKELDEYLRHVAASGDPVYQWSLVKFLFRQKLLNVVMEFYESCPMMDVPISPNLDPFNFETIKKRLLDRYDMFAGVPFTIQRIAELLTAPRKQYNRLDKYMRALEKNVWVVSTRDPSTRETLDQLSLVNGALSTETHNTAEETDTQRLQGESDDSDGPSSDENCPKSNKINETDEESTETPLVEAVEASPDLEPTESLPSSESSSSGDTAENITLELPSSDSDTVPEDKGGESEDKDPIPEPDSTVHDDATEEEKTEEIIVTEVDENETISENVESIEPVSVTDPVSEEPEPEPSPADIPAEEEEFEETVEKPRAGMKRKCEDNEEPSPSKKIETEPVVQSEVPEEAPAQVEEKTPEVAVTELLEIRDAEVSMDSTEVDEKLAMVVEEPELAMDVDETSMQSPMVQEDAVEAMEESELAIS